jgi:hypothetical protein
LSYSARASITDGAPASASPKTTPSSGAYPAKHQAGRQSANSSSSSSHHHRMVHSPHRRCSRLPATPDLLETTCPSTCCSTPFAEWTATLILFRRGAGSSDRSFNGRRYVLGHKWLKTCVVVQAASGTGVVFGSVAGFLGVAVLGEGAAPIRSDTAAACRADATTPPRDPVPRSSARG